MPSSVKRGDAKKLQWSLGRDLTGVTTARVIISPRPGETLAIDRNGVIEDAAAGIVSLQLGPTDYETGKLVLADGQNLAIYYVEVETDGPLTHPDGSDHAYETLTLLRDLG